MMIKNIYIYMMYVCMYVKICTVHLGFKAVQIVMSNLGVEHQPVMISLFLVFVSLINFHSQQENFVDTLMHTTKETKQISRLENKSFVTH